MTVKTIGRSQDNNIIINDEKVSRSHLQLVQDESGHISVVDLGSTNGTFVNGNRIVSETRLKADDELRIGNTVLPWQSYFAQSQTPPVPLSPKKNTPTPNRRWLHIVIGMLVLLLVGGGGFMYVQHLKNAEKGQRETEDSSRQLSDGVKDAELAAAIANSEYEKALRKSIETQSAKDKAKADSLKQVADMRTQELARIKTENEKKLKQIKDTVAAEAKRSVDAANAEKSKQERAAKEAQDKAANAEKERDAAVRETELTKEFYSQLHKAEKAGKLKNICTALGISDSGKDTERFDGIVKQYNNATNNESREKIIQTIKKTLGATTKDDVSASNFNEVLL